MNISPKLLLEELFYKIEQVPTWNPTLVDCRTIQPIDEHTDISYQVCAEAGGGVVSTRDFVNIRHWGVVDGVFVSAGGSVKHPAMPPQPKMVRGENGPGCFAMRPVEGDPDLCLFQWLLDTDLKVKDLNKQKINLHSIFLFRGGYLNLSLTRHYLVLSLTTLPMLGLELLPSLAARTVIVRLQHSFTGLDQIKT